MSILVDGSPVSVIHVRHDGRSHGIRSEDMDSLDDDMSKSDFLTAVENYLDLPGGALSGYEVDITEETENAVLHPQAKFGI